MFAARILALLSLCVACAKPPGPPPAIYLKYHGDVDFTAHERALTADAIKRLEPFVKIAIAWDLDENTFIGQRNENRLARVDSSYPYVAGLDMQFTGKVFAVTTRDAPTRTFIIADRLDNDRQWVHVLMHEFLHGACADHVDDPKAVMYKYSDSAHLAIQLNASDVEELRRCSAEQEKHK